MMICCMSAAPQTRLVRLPRLQSALRHGGVQQVPFHTHAATELVYTVDGNIRIDIDGRALPARKGMLMILPANVPHNQWCGGPWRTLCVLYFDGTHLLDDSPRALDVSADPHIARWIDDLCALHDSQSANGREMVANSFLHALLSRLSTLEAQRRSAEALHPRLAQAVDFIHEHLTEEVDADTLSSAACASYSHLSSLFRAEFGCGPLKYQQNQRLASAQKLLLNPYVSLDEVAAQTGYEDTNYFVRLFRKSYGVPPGKWRKQHMSHRAPAAKA
jgi:AraC-like DNA-binding protein